MKFLLLVAMLGGEGPDLVYVLDSNLSEDTCEFYRSETQVILEQIFDKNDFELWCGVD